MVNPSTAKGGTLTFALSSTPDSFDPGNTYYAWVLDFDNLFTMPLFTYKSCPGTCGSQVVPDLATDMGTVSDNGLTWTFHIQPNVKFENGTVVTSQDVKYAIERTYDRSVMANGPTYYQAILADPSYPGPYKDRAKNLMGLTSVRHPERDHDRVPPGGARSRTSPTCSPSRTPPRSRRAPTPAATTSCTRCRPGRTCSRATSSTSSSRSCRTRTGTRRPTRTPASCQPRSSST